MSPDSLPPASPGSGLPSFSVLPPAVPDPAAPPIPEDAPQEVPLETPSAFSSLPPSIQALAKNPIVLAGGAVFAGVVLSRVLATPSARRFARELAVEAFRQLKPAATGAAGLAGTAAAGSIIEKGVEKYGPQIADYAKKRLADLLKKKE